MERILPPRLTAPHQEERFPAARITAGWDLGGKVRCPPVGRRATSTRAAGPRKELGEPGGVLRRSSTSGSRS
jgi:hypothetical protein